MLNTSTNRYNYIHMGRLCNVNRRWRNPFTFLQPGHVRTCYMHIFAFSVFVKGAIYICAHTLGYIYIIAKQQWWLYIYIHIPGVDTWQLLTPIYTPRPRTSFVAFSVRKIADIYIYILNISEYYIYIHMITHASNWHIMFINLMFPVS